MENFKMAAKTLYGLESLLAEELQQLGAQQVKKGNRIVHFVGDKGFLYKANLSLRTALKILKPIHECRVRDENELYRQFEAFPWEDHMHVDQTFAFDAVAFGAPFTNSMFVAQKMKDALVDRFRKKVHRRPSVDRQFPQLRFHIHIDHGRCTLSLDSSGASLHQRGYRSLTNIAPINEVLAAGMLLLAGWKGQSEFLDPMCGSGTLLIEAAMIAGNIPPQLQRKHFAFEQWPDWDPQLFDTIRFAQQDKITAPQFPIRGFDKAPSAIRKSKDNILQAKLDDYISVERNNFFFSEKKDDSPLFLITNPPYGERLEADITTMYAQIGDTLKKQYTATDAWLISSNTEALKSIGLRPSRKIKLFNGKLECRLMYFPVYQGTKKIHKINAKDDAR